MPKPIEKPLDTARLSESEVLNRRLNAINHQNKASKDPCEAEEAIYTPSLTHRKLRPPPIKVNQPIKNNDSNNVYTPVKISNCHCVIL